MNNISLENKEIIQVVFLFYLLLLQCFGIDTVFLFSRKKVVQIEIEKKFRIKTSKKNYYIRF